MTAFTLFERYDAWGHKRDHATKTSKGRAARQGKWGTELMKTTPRRRTTGEGRSRLGALLLGGQPEHLIPKRARTQQTQVGVGRRADAIDLPVNSRVGFAETRIALCY